MTRKILMCMVVALSLGAQSFPMTKEQEARSVAEYLAAGGTFNQVPPNQEPPRWVLWDPSTALTAEYPSTVRRLRQEVVRLRLALSFTPSNITPEQQRFMENSVTLEDVLEALERRDNDATVLAHPRESK